MEKKFWHEKWDTNEIGFHEDQHHPLLVKHFASLGLANNSHVFVPLCGKSKDMLCIQDMGHRVTGLELSQLAVESFFSENNLDYEKQEAGQFQLGRAGELEILCGDFFAVDRNDTRNIDGIFDRGALVAMPPDMRVDYVETIKALLDPGAKILVIALEYEAGLINPPPHIVDREEIDRLYGQWCSIELLEKAESDVKGAPCHEIAYKLTVL